MGVSKKYDFIEIFWNFVLVLPILYVIFLCLRYCYQEKCGHYPRPVTDIKDYVEKERKSHKARDSCASANHLYFGKGLLEHSCEEACGQDPRCQGYLYLPSRKIYQHNNKIYRLG